MWDIVVKATGHGHDLVCIIGPFSREPTDRQVVDAKIAGEEFFASTTGRPVVTSVAYHCTSGAETVANG